MILIFLQVFSGRYQDRGMGYPERGEEGKEGLGLFLLSDAFQLFLVRAAVRLTGDLASESASAAVKVGR